jgi:hypothetical protein
MNKPFGDRQEAVFFSSGYTIEAVLRLKNPLIEKSSQLEELVKKFNELNDNQCTFMNKSYIIPILEKYQLKGNI